MTIKLDAERRCPRCGAHFSDREPSQLSQDYICPHCNEKYYFGIRAQGPTPIPLPTDNEEGR